MVILTVYVVVALAACVFLAACAWRALVFARRPLHLRWELYPVPHERPDRAAYGGSRYEASESWRHPVLSLWGELRFMLPEMLFLRALRDHNRPLWNRSFPFHFGLYLLATSVVLYLVTAAAALLAGGSAAPAVGALAWGAAAAGAVGLPLALVGAAALLHRRLTDPALRTYSTPSDVSNLVFFVAALGLVGVGWLVAPAGSPGPFAIAVGLLSWNTSIEIPTVLAAGSCATALLAAYIPLTHMAHFVAKYFTYHAVRWDDAALAHNRRLAARIAEYLSHRPTWSAAHIEGGAARRGPRVAASNPPEPRR